jgi:hypothetical protein
MWQFENVNVLPNLYFLTLFWEFVMFFQLSISFHYSTAKQFLYGLTNKNSRSKNLKYLKKSNSVRKKCFRGAFSFSNCHIIGLITGSLVLIVFGVYLDWVNCIDHNLELCQWFLVRTSGRFSSRLPNCNQWSQCTWQVLDPWISST